MHTDPEGHRTEAAKRQTNLSVRADLVEAARSAGVNLSGLLERVLESELEFVRCRHWQKENVASVEAYNRYVKSCGTFAQTWISW